MTIMNRAGVFVRQATGSQGYRAFIPAPLPPDPPVHLDFDLSRLHEAAVRALGQLEGVSAGFAPDRLLYMYVRKEAVLSSAIEGTQSTLTDLLEYENEAVPATPVEDVREVSRYVAALQHGIEQIRSGRLPLSLRLIRDIHRVLMADGRGSHQAPGEFRRTQNWVGGTAPRNARFVPPPPPEMMKSLDNLERFLHDEFGYTPPVIKAGLAHAQFETIHPFLDGNGPIGRLLINLLMVVDGVLSQPFFYLSLYLRQNRSEYYEALQRVRTDGDWEGWLRFYLIGVASVGSEAVRVTMALRDLFEADQRRVAQLGRAAGSALQVFDLLRNRIALSLPSAAHALGLTWPTVSSAMHRLEDLGIARETTGRARDRVYAYDRQLQLLTDGLGTTS
jgi:Fic family protein